jgi:hypothetical protein
MKEINFKSLFFLDDQVVIVQSEDKFRLNGTGKITKTGIKLQTRREKMYQWTRVKMELKFGIG